MRRSSLRSPSLLRRVPAHWIAWLGLASAAALSPGCRKQAPVEARASGEASQKPTPEPASAQTPPEPPPAPAEAPFEVQTETFADVRILRYRVPGFEDLDLQHKQLLYYLYEAALSGRDIVWDQNYRENLTIRRMLEALVRQPPENPDDPQWQSFLVYAKRVWFSNGIHHHYSTKKILPEFTPEWLQGRLEVAPPSSLPLAQGETVAAFFQRLKPILFDPEVDGKRVNLDPEADLIATSATNYYGPGVTQRDVEKFYAKKIDRKDPTPISWGLNSQLVKEGGKLVERTWKVGGMYGPAIERIVGWLEKAVTVAENDRQKLALEKLVEYYRTGDLATFDAYSVAWVQDTASRVDVVNGFIEVYGDPMGYRGAFESVVSFRDEEATRRIAAISEQAQWFEQHSPIPDPYKKENVQGISAKVITVVVESGDAAPATPIGINLPNANWIRVQHGSKSVNLGNIVAAYEEARKTSGVIEEFAYAPEEIARQKQHGRLADTLHTDLHEVIGHASGKLRDGVGTPKEMLKNYGSTIEEARADLVALYYALDPKLVEIGVMDDLDVGRTAYEGYIRNGLMIQLARLELGERLEESHMRNRQLVAKWVYEQGRADDVIERKERDGKTFFVVRDFDALRSLFGELLAEVQRITSEGDFAAAKALVEGYGVEVDPDLHREVKERYAKLNIAPYAGFIQPKLVPELRDGEIVDVRIEYPADFMGQMLEYGEKYAFLAP